QVAGGCASAMGVDVVNGAVDVLQRHVHAAHGAFAARRDHVGAVGSHAVTNQFGMDFGAACLGMFVFLQHQHAAAGADDEAVAIGVIGPRRGFRRVVVFAR